MLCSIIIPVAPNHLETAQQAVLSAENQTVRCEIITEIDHHRTGAAATRNRAFKRASGKFITLLDADDILEPQFVERCAAVYKPGRYVYTDWLQDDKPLQVPPCNRWNPLRVYNLITTFMPRAMWGSGFDTTLPGLEDVDFYLRARYNGWYGVHLEETLWHYRRKRGIGRANPSVTTDLQRANVIKACEQIFKERYGGYVTMGCCGKSSAAPSLNNGAGYVTVYALYSPRKMRGAITGTLYPDPDVNNLLRVDPRDAAAMPQRFKIIVDTVNVSPDLETVQTLVAQALKPTEDVAPALVTEEKPVPKVPPKTAPKPTSPRAKSAQSRKSRR